MSDETTVSPEATETEAAPEASTAEVPAADTTTPEAVPADPRRRSTTSATATSSKATW